MVGGKTLNISIWLEKCSSKAWYKALFMVLNFSSAMASLRRFLEFKFK